MGKVWTRAKLSVFLIILQVIFLVLFGIFAEYGPGANARNVENSRDPRNDGAKPDGNELRLTYPMFQDVHVMMFIGFGFLMTFLKRYGFGSVGLNLLVAAFVLQWATLMGGFLELHHGKIQINIITLLTSDFTAATILISFGAVLGKASALQLIIMALFEVVVFKVNEFIGLSIFGAIDVGGSMFVHVFGAYFGIFCARVIFTEDAHKASDKEGSVYHSDLFSMIGTVFLWLFWPSFNSVLAPGDDQQRAVINTYFSLASCTVVAFAVSSMLDKENKFDMVHVQNATLAGGVAVGTTADMMIDPWGALVIGAVAGALSVIGYKFFTPCLSDRLKFHDTCGVNNLHGMPGILAGIAGIVAAALATEADYGYSLYQIFPARAPANGTELYLNVTRVFSIYPGDGRTALGQAGMQAAALFLTLGMAILGGSLVGLLLKIPIWDQPKDDQVYDDSDYWLLPEEGLPGTGGVDITVDERGIYKVDMDVRSDNDKV